MQCSPQPSPHIQQLPSSYIREILQAATAPDCLSLAGGLPNETLFPYEVLQETFRDLADNLQHHAQLLQYGLTQGFPPLLEALKTRYALSDSHDIMITTGSQQGIDLVARGYLTRNDAVAMETPSYLGAIQAFALTEANQLGVTQTSEGPDLQQLEDRFKYGRCKMFYAVPDFHNPTGCCWSLAVRQQVAELCRRYNVLLLEDAPYRDIRFSGESLPLVSSYCPEQSIVLRSFSKTTMPGLRLASLTGPKPLLQPLLRIKQAIDLHSNLPGQYVLLKLLSHQDYPRHLQTLCAGYGERYSVLCDAVENMLTPFGEYQPVQGGMFLWFTLNKDNAMDVAKQSLANGVAVVPSPVFYSHRALATPALRLNFSHLSVDKLGIAVARLKQVLQRL